jgi:hypothetical protein
MSDGWNEPSLSECLQMAAFMQLAWIVPLILRATL